MNTIRCTEWCMCVYTKNPFKRLTVCFSTLKPFGSSNLGALTWYLLHGFTSAEFRSGSSYSSVFSQLFVSFSDASQVEAGYVILVFRQSCARNPSMVVNLHIFCIIQSSSFNRKESVEKDLSRSHKHSHMQRFK